MAVDRGLIRLLLVLLAIVLAAIWLLLVLAGTAMPAWIPPCSVLALGVAALL